MNLQGWYPLEWTGWISLQSKGLSRVFSNTTVQEHQFFSTQLSLSFSSHIHTWLLEKTIALTRRPFVGKVMSLLFNMLSRLVSFFQGANRLVGLDYRTSSGKSTRKSESDFPMIVLEAWVDNLTSGQTRGREHSPAHQQKIGLKIY